MVKDTAKLDFSAVRECNPRFINADGRGQDSRLAGGADGAVPREPRRVYLLQNRMREGRKVEFKTDGPVLLHLPVGEGERTADGRRETRINGEEIDSATCGNSWPAGGTKMRRGAGCPGPPCLSVASPRAMRIEVLGGVSGLSPVTR